jgi:hypothetical protein
MGNSARKRGLFQIHLSTAVILSMVAGGLVWLDCDPEVCGEGSALSEEVKGIPADYLLLKYGWPVGIIAVQRMRGAWDWRVLDSVPARASVIVVFHLTPVALVALLCEWLIRLRQRQRGTRKSSPSGRNPDAPFSS